MNGQVRALFRRLRAADFEREVTWENACLPFRDTRAQVMTLIDVLATVDRVTAPTYPHRRVIGFFQGMTILESDEVAPGCIALFDPDGQRRGVIQLERRLPPLYFARSVTNGLGGSFRVTGGPFAHPQHMGWHITNEQGFTVAVSGRSRIARCGTWTDPS
jgi:hypothetical protein